ncbi:MAG: SMP-30/gluconolactonase/LRE family protein, partial [Comamonas sp.]|nr:SMP-30/gluconolactonase/LRE family protein [Comamonas sp.]
GPALKTANGPLIHPHSGRLFIADSAAQSIYSFDISSGQAQDQQLFVSTQPQQSAPDGCCWDRDGGLWTAMVRTGQLARYDAQGALSQLISLPVAHPSALCFGGPDLADLYVTSISDSGRLRASGPLDGAILRITGLGYRGLAKPQARILIQD